jgi:excisionase family DNA binding protein
MVETRTAANPQAITRTRMDTATAVPLAHTIPQSCARIGLGRSTLFDLIKAGAIKPIKVGRRTLIAETELQRYVAERMAQPFQPTPAVRRKRA